MPLRLLLTSAGRRVGLLECFRRSAAEAGIPLEILACDTDPDLSAACRVADEAFAVPRCDNPGYVDAVMDIARERGVGLVVPTIDPELAPLAAAISRFAETGARVHVSPPSVIEVARDKLRTADVLAAAGVPVPHTVSLDAVRALNGAVSWPAMVKPSSGSASRGITIVSDPSELPGNPSEPMVVQQLLKGPEYTVNIFVDAAGQLRSVVPHRRLRVRAGEVEKGRTERSPLFDRLAEGVLRALPQARGALCFQAIIDRDAGARVFEINARFGGGYPLTHEAGATFTRWLLEEAFDLPGTAHGNWREGVLMVRYDAALFEG
jgi:carbamoyl-phosphate synthase large subunit